jgi:diguanylate cyclase (GGDEF)-like protein/PAS domain S-box-containing protein
MGLGIWSMHYIGMLAFKLPIPVWYNWPIVLLSLLASIFASAAALRVVSGHGMSLRRTISGSIVMGSGIGAMHFIGMRAMRMGATCQFNTRVVVLSVLIAVLISFIALRLVFLARETETTRLRKVASALAMGAAIPIMHYTGMAAASFRSSSAAPDLSLAVDVSSLGMMGIAAVSIMILGIATLASAQDRLKREPSTMRTRVLSARVRALRVAMTTSCVMCVFEATKSAVHPRIPIWTSDGATILFTTMLTAVLSFIIVRKEERFRFELATSEKRYRLLFEDSVVGIFQTTPEGRPLSINRAFAEMHGYDSPEQFLAEVSNMPQQLFVDPSRIGELTQTLNENGVLRGAEVEVYRTDKTKKWLLMNLRAVRDAGGNVAFHEGTVEDITNRKVAEARVKFLAYYDALTGLPNRGLLQDRLSKALASARRRKDKVAILFLDVDRFKVINDSIGHSGGDLVLQEVAERLKRWAREQDTVARLGGDEFLIVLTDIKDIPDAAVVTERLMDAMIPEFVVQGHSFSISCSVGISIFPEHGADSETLINNADAAMYTAKEKGRNNFRFFTQDMNAEVVERLTLESNLRLALGRGELFLMYQPQMDIATARITGLEALLRWQHPELGLVPPDKFIRIAENCGLIMPIGEWVLRTACSQARKWQDEGLLAVPVAVNVSAVQFRQVGFRELIRGVLRDTGLESQYLELELTESLLLSNADVTFAVLRDLNAMGLKLAIDDFGTGYSSLSYLKQFPVSKLKIDRSFIRDIALNPDDAAITTAIISMAKSLNLKVIAEGVENEAQMSFLRAHHCDEIQGYYFSKPLLPSEVADKLRGKAARAVSAS